MSSWIFVGLDSFVEQNAPLLERFSVRPLCFQHQDLLKKRLLGFSHIVFLAADQGGEQLSAQLACIRPQDWVYLVADLATLSEDEGELHHLLMRENKLRGVLDRSAKPGVLSTQLRGIKGVSDLLFELGTDDEYLEDFTKRLDQVTKHTSVQLERFKRLHRSLVPQRELRFGALKTICKYAAGDSNHSEFWDIARTKEQQVTLLFSSPSSQGLTRALDSIISFLDKEHYAKGDIKIFYQNLEQILGGQFSLFLMLTQVTSLSSSFMVKGPLLTLVNGVSINTPGEGTLGKIQLRGGDKFFIVSEGMVANYRDSFRDSELRRILEKKWQLSGHELTQQIFLEAKMNKDGAFHYHDGTVLIFEAIH